jgi:uncharacterized protein DUF4124
VNAFRLSWVAVLALLLPVGAAAGIYRWTDDSGTTVYSNTPPAKGANVKDVKLVVQDDPARPAPKEKDQAPRREQELEQRIATLERDIQAMQSAPQSAPPVYPAPVYQPPVYQAPVYQAPVYQAPPPAPADYYAGSYPYPPSDYPPPYAYPYVVVVRPARRFLPRPFLARPFFAPRFFAPHFVSRPFVLAHGAMHARR